MRLGIFHVVDVSWILELWSLGCFSVALPRFISFGDSFAMIVIKQNIFFKFVKEFFNCLGFLSREMRSCWPWSQALIGALIVVFSSASGIWDLCCMNLLTKFRNGSLSFCLQLYRSDASAVVSWNI
jgi:hypothetical protein